MSIAAQMLVHFVYYLIGAIQLAMLVRAILSWVAPDMEGTLIRFLYAVTEPFVAAVRKLLARLSIGTEGPIDIAFFVTVILLAILELFFGSML